VPCTPTGRARLGLAAPAKTPAAAKATTLAVVSLFFIAALQLLSLQKRSASEPPEDFGSSGMSARLNRD